MTILQILRNKDFLKDIAPLDAELLLSHVINKPREYLFAHPERRLAKNQVVRFKLYAARRRRGEPVAYITGKKEFFGLEFAVNKNVLIPRPETELLVEAALQRIRNQELGIRNFVDVGTGSGNIIISIVKNIPSKMRGKIKFWAVDISEKALRAARQNAKKHGVSRFIKFIRSDLLAHFLKKRTRLGNLLIAANLPYVMERVYRKNKSGLIYEPKCALFSRKRGLEHYIRLIREIRKLIQKCFVLHVTCFMEISPEQKNNLQKIIQKNLPEAKTEFLKDLSGKTRMAKATIR